ncbi:efflux RND transporter permease subunit [Sodalis-like endosymbiont of Proechinophthirus fluctus]|uniref:efflux RND transporter permease subunit n=1 Tax=Sodalis-like endosymbiont of Proechinophthirus fluctus TaxID=1462730 RepID=UPI000B330BAA|nr:efflux RND transporter permease subunit [Sodalis-like endosymbiont of Proechinophthirus fluctus]
MIEKVENYFMTQEKDNVLSAFSTVGSTLVPGGNSQNMASLFVRLKNWEDRASADCSSFAITERAIKSFNKIPEE